MAFRVANKFPIDTQARRAVGVSLPFSAGAVFNSTYTTANQLKSNLINYFMTNPGERYMNPSFGAGLTRRVFDQLVDLNFETLKQQIQKDLNTYFPAVTIGNLEVYGNEDLNVLKVELTYSVNTFGITDTINLTLT